MVEEPAGAVSTVPAATINAAAAIAAADATATTSTTTKG